MADDEIRAPGLAAALRRHPNLHRQAAVGAIAAGVVLFVVASLVTQGADAVTKAQRAPVHPRPTSAPASPTALPVDSSSATTSAPPAPSSSAKAVGKKRAPVTAEVISSLAANGIPSVALNAYRVAAARMANVEPSCGIDWALLAGIGREESDHGQYGGAVLNADGTTTPHIIGPALNGKGNALIPAPADGVALDGDPTYTHALGPMQFIPQTWAIYGVDANGDGTADIFNIDDAALSAARYLCAAGGDLRTSTGQTRALFAYNHSAQYVAQVLALANAYRTGVSVSGLPVGITTGTLPTVKHTGAPPAANPGAPTAVGGSAGTGANHPSSNSSTSAPSLPQAGHSSSSSPASKPSIPSVGGGGGGGGGGKTSSHPSGPSSSNPPASNPPSSNPPSSSPPASGSSGPSSSPSPSKTCHLKLGTICLGG